MPHGSNVCDVLRLMMRSPLFPVPVEIIQADIDYRDFGAGEVLVPQAGITVRRAPPDHPDGPTGHRGDYAGRPVRYVTDTHHVPERPHADILHITLEPELVLSHAHIPHGEAKYTA